MRVKRARKVRKYLRYYRTCHAFARHTRYARGPQPPGQRLDSASRKRAAAAADGGTLRVSPDPADAFAPRRLAHLDSYSTSSPLETRDIPAPARPRGPRLTPRPPPRSRHPPGALRRYSCTRCRG